MSNLQEEKLTILNESEDNVDSEKLKKSNSPFDMNSAYKAFLREYYEGNYASALYFLEISILKDQQGTYKRNNKRKYNLLCELIDMKKNKHGFVAKNIDYSNCSSVSELFNKALDNKDFKTAFSNIGKMTYQNNSKSLALFKEMLYKMYDLDKLYRDSKMQTKSNVVLQEKEEEFEELIDSYIKDKKYDELFQLLQKKKNTKSLNRLEYKVYNLIKVYTAVVNGNYEVPNHKYLANDNDYLGRFFEALRSDDIYTAYGEIACIYGNVPNNHEFEIYELILKDIIDKYEALEQENDLKEVWEEILNDINSVIRWKNRLDDEDIDKLFDYFDELRDIEYKEIIDIMVSIVELISYANYGEIDASYFANLDEPIVDLEGKVSSLEFNDKDTMFYLRNGDYFSALKDIKNLDVSFATKQEREILRNLLLILTNVLNETKEYPVCYEEIPINHLDNIKKLIEKYDFYGAFNYVLDNNLNDPIINEIFPDIFGMMAFTLMMQEEMYQEFYDLINAGRISDAYINMVNYKEALDKTSLGSIESLQEKYKKIEKSYKRSRGE